MDLSIIIVNYNVKELLRECLTKIKNSQDKLKKEIIVVDNASNDGSAVMLKKEFPETVIIENNKNEGFSRANIQGTALAKGRYILLLNPDAFIAEDTLEETIKFMEEKPGCGILGVRLVNRNGKLQPCARYFPTPWRLFLMYTGLSEKFPFLKGLDDPKFDYNLVREIDWVIGCFFLIRRQVIEKIGFLDKRYFLYYEDVDFCLRAGRNGWKVVFYPGTEVMHLGGASAQKAEKATILGYYLESFKLESEFIYFRKNYHILYVLWDFFFILLLDTSEILKKTIFWKRYINIMYELRHLSLAWKIILLTKYGRKTIH